MHTAHSDPLTEAEMSMWLAGDATEESWRTTLSTKEMVLVKTERTNFWKVVSSGDFRLTLSGRIDEVSREDIWRENKFLSIKTIS